MHAGDVFAEIVAALGAGAAQAAGLRAEDRNELAGLQAGYAGADGLDLAGGFRTDDERHLALGEGHAAPSPHVDMVQRDHADAHRHLAEARRGRRRQVHLNKFAVFHELQGAHGGSFSA